MSKYVDDLRAQLDATLAEEKLRLQLERAFLQSVLDASDAAVVTTDVGHKKLEAIAELSKFLQLEE